MLGAIYGDIRSCAMEAAGRKGSSTTEKTRGYSEITELTLAVAHWLMCEPGHTREGLEQSIQMIGEVPGGRHLSEETIKGVPAAACASPVGLYASTQEEARSLAGVVAETLGEDEEWVAETVAACVFINRYENEGGIEKTRELMQSLVKVRNTSKPSFTEEGKRQTTDDCLQAAATAYLEHDSLEECARHAAFAGGGNAAAIACSILAADKEVRDEMPDEQLLKELPPVLKYILFRFDDLVFPTTPATSCFKVADRVYAGEYPMAKNDEEADILLKMKAFHHFGITHFIDLTQKRELKPYKGMLCDGMTHVRFPIKKHSAPKSTDEVWRIVETVNRILETSLFNKVYLHCSDGVGRTGMVAGCLLAEKTGGNVEDTLRKLRELFNECPKAFASTIPITEEQLMFIQKYTYWMIVRPPRYKAEETRQAIDLGLPSGTKWASCNVGGEKPEDAGDYFNWDDRRDAVRKQMEERWKVPSRGDFEELAKCCSHEWTSVNGVKGMLFTGPNGNSIFLPAAGDRYDCKAFHQNLRGYYWSDTPCKSDKDMAHSLFFYSANAYTVKCYRVRWQSLRLVTS